jgi:hypothetical protein
MLRHMYLKLRLTIRKHMSQSDVVGCLYPGTGEVNHDPYSSTYSSATSQNTLIAPLGFVSFANNS